MATKSGFAAAVLEGSLLEIPVTAAVPMKTGDASSPVFAGSPPCCRGAGASLRLPGQFFNQVQDRLPEPTNYVNQDSLDHSLQPTDTCQMLLMLEGDGQLPSTSRLEPTHPLSPPEVAPVAAPTQATVSPAVLPDPPSRKPGHKATASEHHAREDAALGKILTAFTKKDT
ncbi:hypothetical protein IscW_ISCW019737 [Ixodes scapularis]|uniref:Uncharacterized protein n=1 Tax=Ixodes scapularis TaxID=6945 RepID=B7PU32_IXOSC|nr:hypothetical protein IscW_ISCW019737 [Ixodes scapularis]|eukprot:XP_002405368.1 hypothetical protein IscW_ISCW019737 [Ixodes scapularis]